MELASLKRRLPFAELLLCALCLWAAWYRTPAGALVRSIGAWIFGTRSSARPLLAYFGAGTLVPPRPPPILTGPIPPAQVLAYGAGAVLEVSPAEVAPRLRELSQRLGSDDAALLATFCGEETARYAVDQARSSALDDLARALPPHSEACVGQAAQAAMLAALRARENSSPAASPGNYADSTARGAVPKSMQCRRKWTANYWAARHPREGRPTHTSSSKRYCGSGGLPETTRVRWRCGSVPDRS